MALRAKKQILADKISSLISTKPANFGSEDEAEDTKAKVVEHYEENDNSDDEHRQSKIRTQTVQYLDQLDSRYAGKKISRKDTYDSDINARSNSSDEDSENDEEIDETNISRSGKAKKFGYGQSDGDDDDDDDDDDESIDEEHNEDDSENSSNDAESAEDAEANSEKKSEQSESNDEDEYNDDNDDDDDDDDEEYDIGNPLFRHRGPDSKIKTMSDTNVRADIDKGNCVRSQLKLWEHLLEMRIKLQKCVINTNQMPQYDNYKDFRKDEEFTKKTNEAKSKLTMLLDNMLKLQSSLLKQYPETKDIGAQNRKRKADVRGDEENEAVDSMDEEIPSDTEDEDADAQTDAQTDENMVASEDGAESTNEVPQKRLKLADYEKRLAENHKSYSSYRNSIIQKWNEKTRIGTGIVNKNGNQSTLKQIEFALNDMQKLHKRTQLKRTEYNIVGKAEVEDEDGRRVQEYDPEIYDDNDFYHQLLRDLIEYKSSDVTDPIQLSKQWIQLQNMRSKMKRKIDTRATKGRRIRYNVHNKLVNFLAPITVTDTWTDNAKNELYNSLFGKIKSVKADAE